MADNNNNNGYGNNGGGGFGGGLAQLLGGMFGDSGSAYDQGRQDYTPYLNKAIGAQQPYQQAGQNAIGPYQGMLSQMSNPSDFINHLMGQYQESPWAKYSQQQGTRAAQNLGSAGGMGGTGSSALTQFAQQQAQGISSTDMQNWLGKVLGINTETLGGYKNLISGGQNSANSLSNIFNQGGENMAGFGYGQRAGQQQDRNNIFGGLGNLLLGGGTGGGGNGGNSGLLQLLMSSGMGG